MSSFEEYYYRNIGKQIRKYRVERNISQEQLSEMLYKNLKYIGHIERCERKISNKVLIKILDMWEIQPSEIFSLLIIINGSPKFIK